MSDPTLNLLIDTWNACIAGFLATFVVGYHCYNHRKNAKNGAINEIVLVRWSTTLAVLFSLFYIYATSFSFFGASNVSSCAFGIALSFPCYGLAKFFTYGTFVLRLHIVYSNSEYAIKQVYLILGLVIVAVFYSLMQIYVFSALIAVWSGNNDGVSTVVLFSSENNSAKCDFVPDDFFNPLLGTFEIITNLTYGFLFISPIRQLTRNVNLSNKPYLVKKEMNGKLLSAGLKVAILTTVLIVSTLLANILVAGTFGEHFAPMLFPTELLINAVCLMLMTKFYPENKYFNYHLLCMCCIYCCDWTGYTLIASMSSHNEENIAKDFSATAALKAIASDKEINQYAVNNVQHKVASSNDATQLADIVHDKAENNKKESEQFQE